MSMRSKCQCECDLKNPGSQNSTETLSGQIAASASKDPTFQRQFRSSGAATSTDMQALSEYRDEMHLTHSKNKIQVGEHVKFSLKTGGKLRLDGSTAYFAQYTVEGPLRVWWMAAKAAAEKHPSLLPGPWARLSKHGCRQRRSSEASEQSLKSLRAYLTAESQIVEWWLPRSAYVVALCRTGGRHEEASHKVQHQMITSFSMTISKIENSHNPSFNNVDRKAWIKYKNEVQSWLPVLRPEELEEDELDHEQDEYEACWDSEGGDGDFGREEVGGVGGDGGGDSEGEW